MVARKFFLQRLNDEGKYILKNILFNFTSKTKIMKDGFARKVCRFAAQIKKFCKVFWLTTNAFLIYVCGCEQNLAPKDRISIQTAQMNIKMLIPIIFPVQTFSINFVEMLTKN